MNKNNILLLLFVELGKVLQIAIFWAFPIILAQLRDNDWYLLFFIVSLFMTVGVYNHYETLEGCYEREQEDS